MNALRRTWALYRALFRVGLLEQIQYRASSLIWMLGALVEPTVYLVVWSTVAKSKGAAVGGYTASDFAAYYMILLVVNHMTFTWIMQVFQFRVQFGGLAFELLRPVHPIHTDICANLAYKLLMFVVMAPALLVLYVAFEPRFVVADTWVLFVPALVLAFLMRFMLEWTLALAAFWTTRITAANQAYFSLMLLLSGRVAPMAVLPVWLQDVAHQLPFYYTVAFPVELALGKVTMAAAWSGLLHQFLWALAALALIAFVWRRAVRQFSAVGS